MADVALRILFVDDEPDFLTIGRVLLRDTCGWEIETAVSAKKALELLKILRFDAIISDYRMPGMDGIELLKTVRNDELTHDIAFILLTGLGEEKVAIDAINNGVDFYLPKEGDPVSRFADICHKIQWLVQRNRDRRRQEEQELQFREIIAHSSVGICSFRLDMDGNLVFDGSNPAAGLILKINPPDMVGKRITEVVPGLNSTKIPQKFARIAEAGITWTDGELRLQIGEEYVTLDIQAFQTTPGRMVATFSPVRGPLSAEQQRDPSGLYQSFITASPDVIVIGDITGKITYVSPRAGYVFRVRSLKEIIGTHMLSWILEEYREQAATSIRRHLLGETVPPMIYRLIRDDGSSFPAEIHSAPIWSDGVITGIIAIVRDNSERAAQHEALERANTKLNLLSSITRHDILNKITALRLYCSLIEEEEDPVQNRAMLQKVEEMAGIIADLVAFTSYYQNLGINTALWIVPGVVLEKITEMVVHEGVTIQNGFGNVRVLADPLFEKVLYNLLDNALKYGKTITKITTWYEQSTKGLILVISDNGIGIPDDEKERIFERNVGHGSGLGLFLSREILNVTSMSIIETGSYGTGARFEIVIPPGNFQIPKK